MTTLKQKFESHFNFITSEVEALQANLKPNYTDPNYSLEELFCSVPHILRDRNTWSFPKWEAKHGEIEWYDEYYFDRNSEVELDDFIVRLEDHDMSTEKINQLKEEILEQGYHSFIMDW